MNKLLVINSSLFSDAGQSSVLANTFAAALERLGAEVVRRDLAVVPVPHLDGERFGAFTTQAAARSEQQAQVVAYSDQLIAELQQADTLVLGVPMYNFGVPSTLKAWFDHIARAGVTFRYTDKGAVGLLSGKKAFVFATRGGLYAGTPADTQTPYLRDFLAFIGIDEVEFVYAEGLALGDASREAALEQAHSAIDQLMPLVQPRFQAPSPRAESMA